MNYVLKKIHNNIGMTKTAMRRDGKRMFYKVVQICFNTIMLPLGK